MEGAIKINIRVLCFCLIELVRQTSSNADYISCVEKGLVVSEVFCLPSDYRADVPPPMPKHSPVPVYLKLPVTEISKIDDQRSQISLRLTYKLQWPEPRMILNTSADWSMGEINVRGDMVDHFWTPDIIIHDLVSFYKPEVLNQVAALEIKANKVLYYKVRSDLTTVCKGMKFHRFPLDEHVCYLQLTSFGYNDKEMVLDGQFSYDDSNQRALPFNVLINEISKDNRIYQGSNSNYSVYGLSIHLKRCVSPYLLNVYLPTAIFVVMSWVSFLIPTDVVPARIVLLVTLCLVIINTFNNVTARIPVASQVTALEIWLLACILLVFGALAEYAFILRQIIRLSRHQRRREEEILLASPAMAAASTMAALASMGHGGNNQSSPPLAFKLNGGGMMEVVNGDERSQQQQEQQVRTELQEQLLLRRRQQQQQLLQQQHGLSSTSISEACLGAPHGLHHRHQHLVHISQNDYNNHRQPHVHHHDVEESHQLQNDFHRSMIILDSMSPTGDPDFNGGGESIPLGTIINLPSSSPPTPTAQGTTMTTTAAGTGSLTLPTSSSPPSPLFLQSTQMVMSAAGDGIVVVGRDRGVGVDNMVKPDKRSAELLMRRYQEQVDGKALVIFPMSFLLFNIGYWSHYLLNLEQYF